MKQTGKAFLFALSSILYITGCAEEGIDSADTTQSPNEDTAVVFDVETEPSQCGGEASKDLYKRRIEPLVSGAIPSSCNQCHLSGVELAMFQGNNACETMACLTAMDLINLDDPESSEILNQIKSADPV